MEKTVFFGNGLNRLVASNISWNDLLNTIKGTNRFVDSNLPNTMIYERIVLEKLNRYENILQDEFDVKVEVAELLKNIEGNEIYSDLFRLNIQNYITTNYDYGFVNSIINLSEVNLPIQEFSTEDVYSIRRNKSISNKNEQKKHFWQIHGEIRRPATIMLGLDQYCGYIGKINDYVKGSYKYQQNNETVVELSIEEKFRNNSFNNNSWVELFFNSDVHIAGFTFDFSEIDLWWLITRRARMKKSPHTKQLVENNIHFYCDKIEPQKKSLFESLFVKVHVIELTGKADEYVNHYKQILKML